jgi:hypothetical protein
MALVISMISRRRPGNSFHILTRSSPPQLPEYVVLFLLQSMPTLETEQAFVAAPIEPQAWRVIPRHGVESLVVYPTCERLSIPTRHRRMRPCCLPSQMGASAYAKWAFFPMFSVFTSLIFTMIPLHRAERTPIHDGYHRRPCVALRTKSRHNPAWEPRMPGRLFSVQRR